MGRATSLSGTTTPNTTRRKSAARSISALIKEQYDLVKANDKHAVCCTNLYGETMELYKERLLHLPEDVY